MHKYLIIPYEISADMHIIFKKGIICTSILLFASLLAYFTISDFAGCIIPIFGTESPKKEKLFSLLDKSIVLMHAICEYPVLIHFQRNQC